MPFNHLDRQAGYEPGPHEAPDAPAVSANGGKRVHRSRFTFGAGSAIYFAASHDSGRVPRGQGREEGVTLC